MSGQGVYCYGAHRVRCVLVDNWGRMREGEYIFYSIDKKGAPLVLGLLVLKAERIQIDYYTFN